MSTLTHYEDTCTSYEKDAWKDGKHRGLVSSEVTYLGIL